MEREGQETQEETDEDRHREGKTETWRETPRDRDT